MANSSDEVHIRVIDSHTGGEPTRVVIAGGPDLGNGPLSERLATFRTRFDWFRSAVVTEPRGSDVVVGALLVEPTDATCCAGVIFFNNVGFLGMCGHGAMGVAVTLARLGRIGPGSHRLETPVGIVGFQFDGANRVAIENVPSYRTARKISFSAFGVGHIIGEIAWGGNWFFLVDRDGLGGHGSELDVRNVERLTDIAWSIREELSYRKQTGDDGAEIDHIELCGPPASPGNHGRNFVLCPGRAYDRSPCGTGTSAKLACLYADGHLKEGDIWRQESIIDSVFECSVRVANGRVIPRITGSAFVTAEATLILQPADPFRTGIPR